MSYSPEGEERGLAHALGCLRSVMIAGETLEAWAIQRRMFALNHRRLLVAATSGRLVVITRHLLGGFDVATVRWQDLEEVTLRVGMLGADLGIRAGTATDLASLGAQGAQRVEFLGLRKEQAQAVYRICQAQDQAWREKRRIRELEELRARSGGIQLGAGAASAFGTGTSGWAGVAAGSDGASSPEGARSAQPGVAASAPDAARKLLEAKRMFDDRLITDSEYEAIKARILGG